MSLSTKRVLSLLNTIELAEKNLAQARIQLHQIIEESGLGESVEKILETQTKSVVNNEEYGALEVVEGYFDGENFLGDNGQMYSVPANYASKSQLIIGDRMKRILTENRELFKLIQPADRLTVTGTFAINGDEFFAIIENTENPVRILKASCTYAMKNLGLTPGSKISIIIPRDNTPVWGAFASVVKDDVLASLRAKSQQKQAIEEMDSDFDVLDEEEELPEEEQKRIAEDLKNSKKNSYTDFEFSSDFF